MKKTLSAPSSAASGRPQANAAPGDDSGCAPGCGGHDPLNAFQKLWRAVRSCSGPSRLDQTWEEDVMCAILACPGPGLSPETGVTLWLGQRLFPLALADAAIILLTAGLVWHNTIDTGVFFQDYILSFLPGYGVFL